MKKWLTSIACFLITTVSSSVFAHDRHVHGEAEMNVVLEGNELMIEMRSPLANFLGFEHAPKNERQRNAVQSMAAVLQDANRVFLMTPEAACTVTAVELESAVIGKTRQKTHPEADSSKAGKNSGKSDGHHDLEVLYSYACENPDRLKGIAVRLFRHFQGLEEIEARIVRAGRQSSARLTAKNPKITW